MYECAKKNEMQEKVITHSKKADTNRRPTVIMLPPSRQTHVTADKSEDIIQRVFASGVVGVVAAEVPLDHAALLQHIQQCATTHVNYLVRHPLVNLNIIWDGTLANPAATTMNFVWTGGAAPVRTDLFTAANHAFISAYNFNTPAPNYHIDIEIRLQTPPGNHTTWQENLLHELEAHTRLANKVLEITKKKNDANIPQKLQTSMAVRTEDAEHLSLAKGEGGIEEAQTKTLLNTPPGQQAAVLQDMAQDRLNQLDSLTQHFTFTPHLPIKRMESNDCLAKLKKWLQVMESRLLSLGNLTAPDIAAIDLLIQQIDTHRR